MKKIITFISLFLFTSVNAGGHLSDKDKKATLKCTGLYYANSMIPQGSLELDKIVFSIAAISGLYSFIIKFKSSNKLTNRADKSDPRDLHTPLAT